MTSSRLRFKLDPESHFLEVEPWSCDVFSRKAINKFILRKDCEAHKTDVSKKNELIGGY